MIVMTIFLVNVWFEEGPRGGSPAKDFRRSLTVRFRVVRVVNFAPCQLHENAARTHLSAGCGVGRRLCLEDYML